MLWLLEIELGMHLLPKDLSEYCTKFIMNRLYANVISFRFLNLKVTGNSR